MRGLRQHRSEDAGRPARPDDPGMFASTFPSETAGNGKVVANNRRTGAAQGKGSMKRKVHCQQCGFLADLNRDDHSGGDDSGNGAVKVSTSTATFTTSAGTSVTEVLGNSTNREGAGCPNCGSKNYTKIRQAHDIGASPREAPTI